MIIVNEQSTRDETIIGNLDLALRQSHADKMRDGVRKINSALVSLLRRAPEDAFDAKLADFQGCLDNRFLNFVRLPARLRAECEKETGLSSDELQEKYIHFIDRLVEIVPIPIFGYRPVSIDHEDAGILERFFQKSREGTGVQHSDKCFRFIYDLNVLLAGDMYAWQLINAGGGLYTEHISKCVTQSDFLAKSSSKSQFELVNIIGRVELNHILVRNTWINILDFGGRKNDRIFKMYLLGDTTEFQSLVARVALAGAAFEIESKATLSIDDLPQYSSEDIAFRMAEGGINQSVCVETVSRQVSPAEIRKHFHVNEMYSIRGRSCDAPKSISSTDAWVLTSFLRMYRKYLRVRLSAATDGDLLKATPRQKACAMLDAYTIFSFVIGTDQLLPRSYYQETVFTLEVIYEILSFTPITTDLKRYEYFRPDSAKSVTPQRRGNAESVGVSI